MESLLWSVPFESCAFFLLELGNTISSLFGGGTTPDSKENGTDTVQVRSGMEPGSMENGVWGQIVAAEAGNWGGHPSCLRFNSPSLPPCRLNHTLLWTLSWPCAQAPVPLVTKHLSFVQWAAWPKQPAACFQTVVSCLARAVVCGLPLQSRAWGSGVTEPVLIHRLLVSVICGCVCDCFPGGRGKHCREKQG